MSPISIIIPTYNGLRLLQNLIPLLFSFFPFSKECELIVVDDGSTDGTASYLRNHFPQVKVILLEQNMGFGAACNRGVREAKQDLALIMNNDVRFDSDLFSKPIQTLTARGNGSFAITCKVLKEDGKTIYHGRNEGLFKTGEINLHPLTDEHGSTFFASGVMMLFRRKVFLELGGFDDLYHPFYWEDVDLCYRALKKGYQILYEPGCLIYHNDQQTTVFSKSGSIALFFAKMYARIIQERNQYLFTWKNILEDHLIRSHILWIPIRLISSLRNKDHIFKPIGFVFALLRLGKALRKRHEEKEEGYAVQDHQLLNMKDD